MSSRCVICERNYEETELKIAEIRKPIFIEGNIVSVHKPYQLCPDCQLDIIETIEMAITEDCLICDLLPE